MCAYAVRGCAVFLCCAWSFSLYIAFRMVVFVVCVVFFSVCVVFVLFELSFFLTHI